MDHGNFRGLQLKDKQLKIEGWCTTPAVGGGDENEPCRIRFGSETREGPTERRMLQKVGEIHHSPTYTHLQDKEG